MKLIFLIQLLCLFCTLNESEATVIVNEFKASSGAMLDAIKLNDKVYYTRMSASVKINRGDIVLCKIPGSDNNRIYRIIGLPGEIIEGVDKNIFINGTKLDELYTSHREADIIPKEQNPRDYFGPITVPKEAYFVMGDNRDRSYDSRFFGTINIDYIIGKVTKINNSKIKVYYADNKLPNSSSYNSKRKVDFGIFSGINCNDDLCTMMVMKDGNVKETYLCDTSKLPFSKLKKCKSCKGKEVKVIWLKEDDDNAPIDKSAIDVIFNK